ncbi:MAG: hypothetical protein A2176_15455 [Spirochaetes bacterium RBG_13_51_14]|nr:MAG: hypothetical protein A2176_15455 [Spirochaetes bacterium RBG_13_51_14]
MKRILIGIALAIILAYPARSNMIMDENQARMKVFFTMTDTVGWYAVLRGKIVSYSSKDEFDENDLFGRSQDKSKATVRLYGGEGINVGDTLYVVNEKNLIVAKMTVRTMFRSKSFGDMLVGYGNFKLSSIGDRVIQREEDANAKYSFIYKARGDYYDNTGNRGEAIREYKTALTLDSNNPEAHLALGLIYWRQGLDQFALREFQESYRNIRRLYDNDDKQRLLASMAEIRFHQVYESFIPRKLREEYREEGIRFCKEALSVYPRSEKMNYYLGVFHFRSPNPDERAARDYFLKVVELNPSHADACVALAELYYRHDNMRKALLYAEKALQADRSNPRAQKMLKYLEAQHQVE